MSVRNLHRARDSTGVVGRRTRTTGDHRKTTRDRRKTTGEAVITARAQIKI
jgi:hypothetical protein